MKGPVNPRHGLVLAALGVVFGDIGTSPLYTLRVAIDASGDSGGASVLGILSLIFWALMLVVCLKYVGLVLGLDNEGEGGILALSARVGLYQPGNGRAQSALLFVAFAGAALMFGDAVITPAISVLSAIEGIGHLSPALQPWTIPLTVLILTVLFASQRLGVSKISVVFGPIMLIWFGVLALTGVVAITRNTAVLAALDPSHAVRFAIGNPDHLMVVLGAVFLAVTGGEALYADLGQFGRRAITRAWLAIAFPALILNYFGQGAFILQMGPDSVPNPFYALFPAWAQVPAILLATMAAIVASQAVITGLFSLARQWIKLAILPPMRVVSMSEGNPHDVYLPFVNFCLMGLSIGMAVWFAASDELADAYGVSVAGAMITTTVLLVYSLWQSGPQASRLRWLLILPIVVTDLVFGAALSGKLLSGGALPVSLAAFVLWIVYSWRIGAARVIALAEAQPTAQMADVTTLAKSAVFLARSGTIVPRAMVLMAHLAGAGFRQMLTVTVETQSRPYVPPAEAVMVAEVLGHCTHVTVASGFLQRVDLPKSLSPVLNRLGMRPDQVIYLVGLERCLPPRPIRRPKAMLLYTYSVLTRLAMRRADQFSLPTDRTLEIGVPWQL
jgi:KUP system potassium uptake protein